MSKYCNFVYGWFTIVKRVIIFHREIWVLSKSNNCWWKESSFNFLLLRLSFSHYMPVRISSFPLSSLRFLFKILFLKHQLRILQYQVRVKIGLIFSWILLYSLWASHFQPYWFLLFLHSNWFLVHLQIPHLIYLLVSDASC